MYMLILVLAMKPSKSPSSRHSPKTHKSRGVACKHVKYVKQGDFNTVDGVTHAHGTA